MKKLLLIVPLLFFGCSSTDDICFCNEAVFAQGSVEDPEILGSYGVEMDCSTQLPRTNPTGITDAYFLRCDDSVN